MTFNLLNCVPSLIYGGLVKRQIAIVCTFLLWYCHKEEKVTSITREANLKVLTGQIIPSAERGLIEHEFFYYSQ